MNTDPWGITMNRRGLFRALAGVVAGGAAVAVSKAIPASEVEAQHEHRVFFAGSGAHSHSITAEMQNHTHALFPAVGQVQYFNNGDGTASLKRYGVDGQWHVEMIGRAASGVSRFHG